MARGLKAAGRCGWPPGPECSWPRDEGNLDLLRGPAGARPDGADMGRVTVGKRRDTEGCVPPLLALPRLAPPRTHTTRRRPRGRAGPHRSSRVPGQPPQQQRLGLSPTTPRGGAGLAEVANSRPTASSTQGKPQPPGLRGAGTTEPGLWVCAWRCRACGRGPHRARVRRGRGANPSGTEPLSSLVQDPISLSHMAKNVWCVMT